MYKKYFIITIIMVIIIPLLTGCTVGYCINNFQALKLTIDELDYNEDAKLYYYDNVKDLEKLNNDIFTKYDSFYFKDNSLLVITLIDNNLNVYVEEKIKNGTISINREIVLDSELINWTLLLEINDKIPDIENFIVYFNDYEQPFGHNHIYQESIIEATCEEQGYTQYQCECGESYKDNYTEVVECKYENGKCIWCQNLEQVEKYKLSNHSEDLIDTTTGLFYDGSSTMEGCGYTNIPTLYYRYDNNDLDEFKYIDMTSKFDDYYTCCYFNLDKKHLLDSVENIDFYDFEDAYYKNQWGAWSGINFYLARFHIYNLIQGGMNNENSLITLEDIKWLEVPKRDIILNEIDNYFLIAITESKTVIETSIFGEEQKEYKWYFETKYLYNDGLKYPEYDEFYNDWINHKYLIDYCEFATLICNNTLNSFSGLHLLKYNALRIENIDGIDYIRTKENRTLWGDQDLKDLFEYKEDYDDDKLIYYWFKYEDIMNLIQGD